MKQIAARHHIHRVTVSEVLNRTGTTKRPKGMSPSQVDIAGSSVKSRIREVAWKPTPKLAVEPKQQPKRVAAAEVAAGEKAA